MLKELRPNDLRDVVCRLSETEKKPSPLCFTKKQHHKCTFRGEVKRHGATAFELTIQYIILIEDSRADFR
jgi:hypothetical protein